MNSDFRLPVNDRQFFVIQSGPYKERPRGTYGVKMAAEINRPYQVSIPTEDFSVPTTKQLYRGLNSALDAMIQGKPLYVGCMGGIGRTGLFLSVLAKTFGIKDPVSYIRLHVNGHAVERPEQHRMIEQFRVTKALKRKVRKAQLIAWVNGTVCLTQLTKERPKLRVRLARVIANPRSRAGKFLDKRLGLQ